MAWGWSPEGVYSADDFEKMMVSLRVGDCMGRDTLLHRLVDIRYERNDIAFERNMFRVRGILFNKGIRVGDICLRLVVVVVGHEVFHRVVGEELLELLAQLGGYERNDIAFERNMFRVRGDTVELWPAYWRDSALRVEFFGDEIDRRRCSWRRTPRSRPAAPAERRWRSAAGGRFPR